MPDAPPPHTVALVRDLLFSSRIRATAKDLGVEVRLVRAPRDVVAAGGKRLLVDLNQEGAIEAARAWKNATGGTIVGFVSHVDVETVNTARAAGIDQVMARSRFVEVLPELLSARVDRAASSSPGTPGEAGEGAFVSGPAEKAPSPQPFPGVPGEGVKGVTRSSRATVHRPPVSTAPPAAPGAPGA